MTNIITIGSQVEGNWGAMHPINEGVVTQITENGTKALIEWDCDLGDMEVEISHIHEQGWTSVNGSGVGIFLC